VKVIADSLPLIALSKIGHFGLLEKLFGAVAITPEVYDEVVVKGAGPWWTI
jgi:predicted nucleic acid-binding protein